MIRRKKVKIATAQNMRKIDELAVQRYGLKIEKLMESAGAGVVRIMEDRFGNLRGKKITVLCGKGHNGGDGMAAARLLKKKGAKVVAVLPDDPGNLAPETLRQLKKIRSSKVPLVFCERADSLKKNLEIFEKSAFVVDALLGTGLTRPVKGIYGDLIRLVRNLGKTVVAVDIPSGMSADSGEPLGEALKAEITVTFGLPKIGFFTLPGLLLTGEVRTINIGFPNELLDSSFVRQELTDLSFVRASLPRYGEGTHKGTRGRVLVVGGSPGLTGAPSLAAWGALRIGAGLVTVACPKSLNSILEIKLTEPMTAPMPEVGAGYLSLEALGPILELASKAKAVVLGPGLGRHKETGKLVRALLARITVPMVLDADALYPLGENWNS